MQRLAEIEKEKIKKLTSDITNWELAKRITAYLDTLDQLSPSIEGLSDWISWSREYANTINPLENQDSIIFNLQDHPYLFMNNMKAFPDNSLLIIGYNILVPR